MKRKTKRRLAKATKIGFGKAARVFAYTAAAMLILAVVAIVLLSFAFGSSSEKTEKTIPSPAGLGKVSFIVKSDGAWQDGGTSVTVEVKRNGDKFWEHVGYFWLWSAHGRRDEFQGAAWRCDGTVLVIFSSPDWEGSGRRSSPQANPQMTHAYDFRTGVMIAPQNDTPEATQAAAYEIKKLVGDSEAIVIDDWR